MNIKKLFSLGAEMLFPNECVFCGELVELGDRFCDKCTAMVKPNVFENEFQIKDKTMLVTSLFAYENIRQGILNMKFKNTKTNAAVLAELMLESKEIVAAVKECDLITCVPISKKRMRERGYNQSAVVATAIGKSCGVPFIQPLAKITDNPAQSTLSREDRQINVGSVYELVSDEIKGKRVAIVDDILTTGATICACAEQLYKGGADTVCGICIAHAAS